MALVVAPDAVRRVAEPDRAVALDDEVVGRVEPLALPVLDERRQGPVAAQPLEPPMAVRAGEDRAVAVEGVAVLELRRLEEHRRAVVGMPAQHPVVVDVAPQDRAVLREPDRPLGPVGPGREAVEDGAGPEEGLERRVLDDRLPACDGRAVRHRRASQARLEQLEPLEVGAQGRGAREPDRPEPERSRPLDVARLVVDEHRLPGHHAVAVDQRLEDGGLRLRRADLARHDDPAEPGQERVALQRDRERLGRPVGQGVQRDARVAELGEEVDGRLDRRRPASRPSARGRRGSGPRAPGGSRRARRRRRPRAARGPARGSMSAVVTSARNRSSSSGSSISVRYR